jgi:hypothetical protein
MGICTSKYSEAISTAQALEDLKEPEEPKEPKYPEANFINPENGTIDIGKYGAFLADVLTEGPKIKKDNDQKHYLEYTCHDPFMTIRLVYLEKKDNKVRFYMDFTEEDECPIENWEILVANESEITNNFVNQIVDWMELLMYKNFDLKSTATAPLVKRKRFFREISATLRYCVTAFQKV